LRAHVSFEEERRRLVSLLRRAGFITSSKVERALLAVPRELFAPEDLRELAYEDRPLPIGYGQTISAPSVVARMTELLDPEPGMRVLEVGTGSGYQAAVLAEIVAPTGAPRSGWGHVWSIERIPELAEWARRNLEAAGYSDRVTVIVGDGSKGYPPAAPYDRIIVTAAAPEIPPPLLEQLAPSGRLVAPVGDRWGQRLVVAVKEGGGSLRVWEDIEVIFVPLVGEYGWPPG
jgi:protein-L-isoaspartate(D-aspartate) O-methyltransferase